MKTNSLFDRMILIALILLVSAVTMAAQTRPNIVLIMVDDMGFSDIGCYGGEIQTPHIDSLAQNGIRFRQFYNTARCCPTRASLMTGLFPHQTGIGEMTNSPNDERNAEQCAYGYTGFLNRDCVTLAEVLQSGGYHTYMTGKWHLGYHDKDRWPLQRGFERYYGIISGACSYFDPRPPRGLTLDNTPVDPEGENYYTTDAFANYAVRFITEQKDDKPFFLYLAFNAPHWPLHAKEQDIKKYVGKYREGWDQLRQQRHKRMIEMGIVEEKWGLSERDPGVRAWEKLTEEQKKQLDYRMAVYAAQVDCVDQNVGKLLDTLKDINKLDNTLVLFLSDNGGCAEPYKDLGGGKFEDINNPAKNGSISYGQGWANASNTPFRLFKTRVHEGGISTPLIAYWPDTIKSQKGKITNSTGYLIDIMPTLLEVSGASYPEEFKGHKIHATEGISLLPVFKEGKGPEHEWMFWEHINNCAVRHGKWKAIKKLKGDWELYNLEEDRTEMHNLADQHPDIVKEMDSKWNAWAKDKHVLPKSL